MKFPYFEFETVDTRKKIYRPAVRLFFKNENKFIYSLGIIDSGADYTILPIEYAGELGLKLDVKKKTSFIGAGKNPFTVYPSPKEIQHVIRQNGFRNIEWKSIVYFAEGQPTILLGNKGFLELFKITLDGTKRELEITK